MTIFTQGGIMPTVTGEVSPALAARLVRESGGWYCLVDGHITVLEYDETGTRVKSVWIKVR